MQTIFTLGFNAVMVLESTIPDSRPAVVGRPGLAGNKTISAPVETGAWAELGNVNCLKITGDHESLSVTRATLSFFYITFNANVLLWR